MLNDMPAHQDKVIGFSNAAPRLDLADGLKASNSGDVRIGPVIGLPSVLSDFGIDPLTAYQMAGLSPEAFSNADNRVPLLLLGNLLKSCVQLTQCDHFGLLVGERFELTGFGHIGKLMSNSATVGNALRSLLHSLHLHDRGAAPILLSHEKDWVLLGYSIYRHDTPACAQIYDAAITIAFRILCELCGPEWQPLQVQFSHKRPDDIKPFRKLFRSRICFDADISGVVFDSAWMQQPIRDANPALHAHFSKEIRDADSRSFPSLKERVQRVLRQMLLCGTFSGAAIAQLFGVHERTLRRQLTRENISLQQLVNATRFELAKELLENTALPIAEIAVALRYADSNVFSRAFRSWANVSPSQWRKARPA